MIAKHVLILIFFGDASDLGMVLGTCHSQLTEAEICKFLKIHVLAKPLNRDFHIDLNMQLLHKESYEVPYTKESTRTIVFLRSINLSCTFTYLYGPCFPVIDLLQRGLVLFRGCVENFWQQNIATYLLMPLWS